ncbi:MAG: glycosyltransferase family 2 protein, partial [Candidatus Nezhaarchaeota archaeon]|nr:glycosyltransferase family 2 protein [Candidatus Nezhaarchaeota archaeon]
MGLVDDKGFELSVVVPTFNERDNIGELIERIERALEGVRFEIVVVDDNSPDGTAEVAGKLGELYGNVRVVKRPGKLGLGPAIVDGISASKASVIAVLDADLQHPPELLPAMLARVRGGYDLVIASRFAHGGGVEGWSVLRKLASKVAGAIARLTLPRARQVRDVMSGYFMFKREILSGVELRPRGFKILLEIVVKGAWARAVEVPYTFKPRSRGRSKLSLTETLAYLRHVLELSSYRPLKFAAVGALGVVVNEGLLHALIQLLPLHLAGLISIEASILNNFALNDSWTFRDRRAGRWIARCAKYHAAVFLGALVNYVTLLALAGLAGLHYLVANLLGILLGFAVKYSIGELFVWRAAAWLRG